MMMQPIVQIEFFQVNFDKGFDAMFTEMAERVRDTFEGVLAGCEPLSSGIKTTVRFYDENGTITNLVHKLSVLEKSYWANIPTKKLPPIQFYSNHFKRTFENWKRKHLEMKLRQSALELLRKRLSEPEGVAGEQVNFSFRYIRGEEKHELFQSVSFSKKALWFIYEPNLLLSEKNEIRVCYF